MADHQMHRRQSPRCTDRRNFTISVFAAAFSSAVKYASLNRGSSRVAAIMCGCCLTWAKRRFIQSRSAAFSCSKPWSSLVDCNFPSSITVSGTMNSCLMFVTESHLHEMFLYSSIVENIVSSLACQSLTNEVNQGTNFSKSVPIWVMSIQSIVVGKVQEAK